MGLNARDRQALDSIEAALASADPDLAATLNAFTRLNADKDMPAPERMRRRTFGATGRQPRGRALGRAAGRSSWRWAWLGVLWLVISLALITLGVFLNHVSPGSCPLLSPPACTRPVGRRATGHKAAAPADLRGRQASKLPPALLA